MIQSKSNQLKKKQRYAKFVNWVRKTHGWIGLWGALLGLVFGLSGIWLNHRAILKLPPMSQVRTKVQLQVPASAAISPEKMESWLQTGLHLPKPANNVRIEPSRIFAWNQVGESSSSDAQGSGAQTDSAPYRQPERWQFNFGGPHQLTQVEYWVGNNSVSVQNTSNGILATLTNLHKGTGMSAPWILFIDSIAGSMIFLSVSGVILWVQMNRRRAIGVSIFSVSTLITLVIIGLRI
jgi:hypothetical protein